MTQESNAAVEWRAYWPLPIATALGYATSVIHLYALGPFIDPLQDAFGWTRTQVTVGIALTGLVGAIFGVPVGMLVDRVGPRIVALFGVPMMTMSFAMLGLSTGGFDNWLLLWTAVALGNLGLQGSVWTSMLASRFEASRGLAFAIAFGGASLGATVYPILATWLIHAYGWRTAFIGVGGICAAVTMPIMIRFFHGGHDLLCQRGSNRPGAAGLPGMAVADAWRSSAFYTLVIAGALLTFTTAGMSVHFVPLLRDRGVDALSAAAIASLIGVFSVIGRVSTGLLMDRFPGRIVSACVFSLRFVACALLLFGSPHLSTQIAASICFGATVGAEVDVIANLASRHFGPRNYGVIFGMVIAAFSIGVAFGPFVASLLFDRCDGYAQFLVLAMVFMSASSLGLLSLPDPAFGTTSRLASRQ